MWWNESRICEYEKCGKEYLPEQEHQKYCSEKHKKAAENRRNYLKNPDKYKRRVVVRRKAIITPIQNTKKSSIKAGMRRLLKVAIAGVAIEPDKQWEKIAFRDCLRYGLIDQHGLITEAGKNALKTGKFDLPISDKEAELRAAVQIIMKEYNLRETAAIRLAVIRLSKLIEGRRNARK